MKPLQWEQGRGDVSVLEYKDSLRLSVCKISHVSGSTEKLKFIWQVEAEGTILHQTGLQNVLKMVIAVLSKTNSTLGFKARCLCLSSLFILAC